MVAVVSFIVTPFRFSITCPEFVRLVETELGLTRLESQFLNFKEIGKQRSCTCGFILGNKKNSQGPDLASKEGGGPEPCSG
jgi:hypothetical protein